MVRRLMSLTLLLVAALAVVLAALWALQRRLIYFPFGRVPAPSAVGLDDAEEVAFAAGDGVVLRAWFVPAPASPARATVLVLNGNAGNRAYRAPLARALRARGLHVLLLDYRGYGGSGGSPSESGLLADARAAREFLLRRPDVDPARVVYFGESLGAAVALALALDHPPAALVLRSPFTSLADVGRVHYPILPVGRLLRDRYANAERIARLRAPLAVIAGDRDSIVPFEQSRALFDAAPDPKRFVAIRGADHNDEPLMWGPEVVGATAGIVPG
jgi:fermentation-respiration switch protein FrsA (DUF1100 family)